MSSLSLKFTFPFLRMIKLKTHTHTHTHSWDSFFHPPLIIHCLLPSKRFLHQQIVVVQLLLCSTLCDAMDCSKLGFPVLTVSWSLLKFMSIELMMTSKHLISCYPLLLLPYSFPSSGSFPMNQLFASGGQSIGASALILIVNT